MGEKEMSRPRSCNTSIRRQTVFFFGTYPDDQSVSLPTFGVVSRRRIVAPGGWIS